uniref:Uncharacterized protein n=1 Tax=Anguilla anguilla TaxID=7936 RepID=A0A0E9VGB8_ANGAN
MKLTVEILNCNLNCKIGGGDKNYSGLVWFLLT